ncbi:unnamed protein product [Thelazia callipaeda]|uniref:SAP30_Sin3_bdg domain-containing protein n=1 Tax=Thelazia callipaeda TaxID=103827 RepID=A0A0N5D926_THECL|nr:unnamed protein product [Thelazia callipaeda]
MSCSTVESKPSQSVMVKGPISVTISHSITPTTPTTVTTPTTITANIGTPEISNSTTERMTYPYKKRAREEFEENERKIAQKERELREQQGLRQQELLQEVHLQEQQSQDSQQRQKLKVQSGFSNISEIFTASETSPDEAGTSGLNLNKIPGVEMPPQLHDDTSDVEDDSEETSSDTFGSSDDTNLSDLDEAAWEAKLSCCLATAVGNKYFACGRPAIGIWFSNKLRQKALKKKFPFAFNKMVASFLTAKRGHWYLCLFHYRVIMHEPRLKANENLDSRDLTKYLAVDVTDDEIEALRNDPLIKSYVKDVEGARDALESQKKKKKGRSETSGVNVETNQNEASNFGVLAGIWPFSGTDFHSMKRGEKVTASASGKEMNTTSPPPQVPFHVLSATTLRRYKKHFNLPHRSSANTKQQLLQGIPEHFETIDVPPYETVSHFLHTVKTHKNKLDYPTGE